MARLALSLGAGIAGGLIGGPVGFQVGMAIGGIAGGLIFGEDGPKGPPRPQDRQVTGVSYGAPIAIVEGTDRIAANRAWVNDNKIEARKVKVSTGGGKGLGGGGGSTSTWEWFGTWSDVFCEGPIDGFRRIWFGPKLIYDISSTTLADEIAAGGAVNATTTIPGIGLRLYLGTEDQLPDPYIQADRGADEVSAMRGLAYITFVDVPLANFGNAIPQEITAEVVRDGVTEFLRVELSNRAPGGIGSDAAFPATAFDPYQPFIWNVGSSNLTKWNLASSTLENQVDIEAGQDSDGDDIEVGPGTPAADEFGFVYVPHGLTNFEGKLLYKFDAVTLAYVGHIDAIDNHFVSNWTYRSFLGGSQRFLVGISTTGRLYVVDAVTFAVMAAPISTGSDGTSWTNMVDISPDLEVWVTDNSASELRRWQLLPQVSTYGAQDFPWTLSHVSDTDLSATFSSLDHVHYWADEGVLLLGQADLIAKFDPLTETIIATVTGTGVDENAFEWQKGPVNGKLWGKLTGAAGHAVETDVSTMTVTRNIDLQDYGASATPIAVGYDKWSDSLIVMLAGGGFNQCFLPRLDPLAVDLADIITRMSARVGLAASDIDVSLVTDTVRGYTLRRPTSARAYLEPLLAAHFIVAAEVDGKIKFIPLGQAATVTVSADDLGAELMNGQGGGAGELAVQELMAPQDPPMRLLLQHVDPDSNYDPNVQPAKRPSEAVVTRSEQMFDTPEVLSPTEAARIVERMLYLRYIERPIRITLPHKYGKLAGGDVINVPVDGTTLTCRIAEIDEGAYLAIRAIVQSVAGYTSTVAGQDASIPDPVLQLTSPTQLFLIDCNMLRDEDDNGGHYLGLARAVAVGLWSGAQVFKSADGINFAGWVSFDDEVEWGVATHALAEHHCTTTDAYNTFTVQIVHGEAPASITEAELLNGGNAMLVQCGNDWELAQAQTVTDLGDGQVRFSTMLRGRRGTEQQASGHAAGDRVIFLSAETLQRLQNAAEIGFARYYKATTFSQAFSPVGAAPFTNNARGLMPYAPTEIAATRDGSNNISGTFKRRTRRGGLIDWSTNEDLPLGETTEEYEVDVLLAGVVVRTIDGLTAEAFSYSAANQATDGITPGDPVDVAVYQIGSRGRGRAGEATI